MDLNVYFKPIIKWWWLIAIASFVAAFTSYLVTRQQPAVYQARATLVVGQMVFETNPDTTDLYMGQQLSSFYADMAFREPVRDATMEALNIPWLPTYSVQPVQNGQLLEIVVSDTSPERAQLVANELGNQLISQSPAVRRAEEGEHQQFIKEQLNYLESEIKKTLDIIKETQEKLADLVSAREIADTQADLDALQSRLTSLQSNYATLLVNSDQGASNVLTFIERATLPQFPVGPRNSTTILLAAVIGLSLATAGAYLIEYLDDTLKDVDDVRRAVTFPVIGLIAEVREQENDATYVANKPRSIVAEAYRNLRTNLDFTTVDRPLKTILVTSTGVGEGKTSVAINLAVVIAQGGKNVILLDADLREPSVFRKLGLSNVKGLSDLFRDQLAIQDAFTPWTVDNLRIIMSGDLPPNPADLLSSKKMDAILEDLKQEADVVIVDGPPLLVTDAGILAKKVDGVLVVFRHGYTRRDVARNVSERFKRIGANVLGVVFNRMPRSGLSLYGHYGKDGYYSSDRVDRNEAAQNARESQKKSKMTTTGRLPRFLAALFGRSSEKRTRKNPKNYEMDDHGEVGDYYPEKQEITLAASFDEIVQADSEKKN